MSPDLTDNIIMLCGATCYDCYRMLRDDAGVMRKKMDADFMLNTFAINDPSMFGQQERKARQKIQNSDRILNIISSI